MPPSENFAIDLGGELLFPPPLLSRHYFSSHATLYLSAHIPSSREYCHVRVSATSSSWTERNINYRILNCGAENCGRIKNSHFLLLLLLAASNFIICLFTDHQADHWEFKFDSRQWEKVAPRFLPEIISSPPTCQFNRAKENVE